MVRPIVADRGWDVDAGVVREHIDLFIRLLDVGQRRDQCVDGLDLLSVRFTLDLMR
jgi:hypothetical protein